MSTPTVTLTRPSPFDPTQTDSITLLRSQWAVVEQVAKAGLAARGVAADQMTEAELHATVIQLCIDAGWDKVRGTFADLAAAQVTRTVQDETTARARAIEGALAQVDSVRALVAEPPAPAPE